MCSIIGRFYDKFNEINYSLLWTASLVLAHFSCEHTMLFGKNKHLEGLFDHITSQRMYYWDFDFHHILFFSFPK
jgi:hypothetical protein